MDLEHREVLLLDGGFVRRDTSFLFRYLFIYSIYQGTTLEDVFGKDISNPLWSASLIDNDPDAIVQAHKAFIDATSDIVLTST